MVSHNSRVLSLSQNSSMAEEESNWQIFPMERRLFITISVICSVLSFSYFFKMSFTWGTSVLRKFFSHLIFSLKIQWFFPHDFCCVVAVPLSQIYIYAYEILTQLNPRWNTYTLSHKMEMTFPFSSGPNISAIFRYRLGCQHDDRWYIFWDPIFLSHQFRDTCL